MTGFKSKKAMANNNLMTNMDMLMYESGITADGCWNKMDSYDQDAVMRLCKLVMEACVDIVNKRKDAAIDAEWLVDEAMSNAVWDIEEFFGVE